MKQTKCALSAALLLLLAGCQGGRMSLTGYEKSLIGSSDSIMKVLIIGNPEDLRILRSESTDLTDADIRSRHFGRLSELMVATMTDPSQDGVGIAAPQVGLSRRVVAVQRFDKEGSPIEVYPNIRIERYLGETQTGREGCLSVPGKYGTVKRYQEIIISYRNGVSAETVRDTVKGYTAVIFQHEADHLDGILYIDKADTLFER